MYEVILINNSGYEGRDLEVKRQGQIEIVIDGSLSEMKRLRSTE